MKTTLLLVAALVAGTVVLLTPNASAVDVCTSATGNCGHWIVCYGATRGPSGQPISCKEGIDGPHCDPAACDPY